MWWKRQVLSVRSQTDAIGREHEHGLFDVLQRLELNRSQRRSERLRRLGSRVKGLAVGTDTRT